jgi:two-component system response regulator GlrR
MQNTMAIATLKPDHRGHVLLVDDDPGLLRLLSIRLEQYGFSVEPVSSASAGLQYVQTRRPDAVVTDLRMDGMDGINLLEALQREHPGLPVILITAHGTIPDAVRATQSGALAFLTKPVDRTELLEALERALRTGAAQPASNDDWRAGLVSRSGRMEELLSEAHRVAQTDTNVLLTGESGTGKELIAEAIHRASARHEGPFVPVYCGSVEAELLESELFGHVAGAFPGATEDREGLFLRAAGGTLYIDEIGDLPPAVQGRMLRALQEGKFRPLGSTVDVDADVRVISTTSRDLASAIEAEAFREDLYYRLNVVRLQVPSLSERREDIPALATLFLQRCASRDGQPPKVISPEAMELLVTADWPGNARQLANLVEQVVALSPASVISAKLVENTLGVESRGLPPLAQARDEFVRNYLLQLLQTTRGNVSQAARLAQRNRTEFYKLLARHDINPQAFKRQG